jgi:hypothetical protein
MGEWRAFGTDMADCDTFVAAAVSVVPFHLVVTDILVRDQGCVYFELLLEWQGTEALALFEDGFGVLWVDSLDLVSNTSVLYRLKTCLHGSEHRRNLYDAMLPGPVLLLPSSPRGHHSISH